MRLSQGDSWIISSSGSGGAPRSTQNSEKAACISPTRRAYSARKAAHSERSPSGSPEKGGGSAGSFSSSGLQETIRTQGRPLAGIAGNAQTLSSTIASGSSSPKISASRSST